MITSLIFHYSTSLQLKDAFWHTTLCTMYSLPLSSFVSVNRTSVSLVVAHDGFLYVKKIVHIFHSAVATLIILHMNEHPWK